MLTKKHCNLRHALVQISTFFMVQYNKSNKLCKRLKSYLPEVLIFVVDPCFGAFVQITVIFVSMIYVILCLVS